MKTFVNILSIIVIIVMILFFGAFAFAAGITFMDLSDLLKFINTFVIVFGLMIGFIIGYLLEELFLLIGNHKYIKTLIFLSLLIIGSLSSCATGYRPISSHHFKPTHKAKCRVYDDAKHFGSVKESMKYYDSLR